VGESGILDAEPVEESDILDAELVEEFVTPEEVADRYLKIPPGLTGLQRLYLLERWTRRG
jgi:hypothetical protein